jgi:hypothetical protein
MRRVLFRLWLVVSVLWVALIYFVSANDSRPDALTIAAKVAFVPPAIIFVVGAMLVWAFARPK